MANYRAVANGNWSNLATWQDDSLGYFTNSTVLPTSADNVYSNNFTVTIDGVRNANLIANTAFTGPTFLGAMSIPLMTSNTTPSGIANASSTTNFSGGIGPYGAFDRNTNTLWESNVATAWLSYQFPTGKIIKRYGFFSYFSNNPNPRTWTFEGSNDGSTWTTLDTQTNFITTISTFYSFDISSNVTSYLYYRINISATQAVVTRGPIVMSLEMSELTDLYGTAVAGGGFTFANGGDLTCAASNGVINRDVGLAYCLTFDLPSPNSATLRASTSTAGAVINGRNIFAQNTGTFNMVGNYDIQSVNQSGRATIIVNASTTVNIIGNITNSQGTVFSGSTLWITAGTPTINITGNVTGGSTNTFTAANGNGIYSAVASTINITGNITTNLTPSIWVIGGTLNITGNITGGISFPAIANATTASTILATGITTAGTGAPAIYSFFALGSGYGSGTFVRVSGTVVNSTNNIAIVAPRVTVDTNTSSWLFQISTGGNRTLYAPGVPLGNPATSNVRFGTTYGASGGLAGTMRVPSAINVLQGVEVDNTTGTLLMTPADFWNYLIASGFDPNSIGDRLQNASTVATTGGQIANYNI